jgi:antibiotic biosynthesis monooxygenase (ABM) superfamily enzyme
MPQMNISGKENMGHLDYAIKKIISEILEEYFVLPRVNRIRQLWVSAKAYYNVNVGVI